jgi:hypothetical protein
MLEEAAILDGQDRIDHGQRYPLERNGDALLDEEAERRLAVPVEDDGRLGPRSDGGQGAGAVELSGNRGGEDGDSPCGD